MRILLISNLYYPEEIGGAEMYVRKLAQAFATDNAMCVLTTGQAGWKGIFQLTTTHDGTVEVRRFTPANIATPYRLRRLPMYLRPLWHILDLWNIPSYFIVKHLIKTWRPDVIHTHNISGLSGAVFSAVRNSRVPIIHTLHDYHLLSPWSVLFRGGRIIARFRWWEKIYQSFYQRVTKSINTVTAPSRFVLSFHAEHGFFAMANKITIPLGISGEDVYPEKQRALKPTFVFIGQITDYKGVEILLESLKSIPDVPIRLVIAGTGPDRERYMSLSANEPRVEWPGFVSGAEKKKLLSEAWAMVVPSIWYDNSPVTIYESLASGTPVIGSNIGGIPELVTDGINGWIFPPGDVLRLGKILRQLAQNPDQTVRQLPRGGFKGDKFSMDHHLRDIMKVYNTLTGHD